MKTRSNIGANTITQKRNDGALSTPLRFSCRPIGCEVPQCYIQRHNNIAQFVRVGFIMPQYCAVVSGTDANVFATLVICVHLFFVSINAHRTSFSDQT